MAENEEITQIAHLLEVEKQASVVISAATIESDGKISQAKVKAEAEFKKLYSDKANDLQKNFEQNKETAIEKHNCEINDYKNSIEQLPQDSGAFASFLDKVLFE